MHAPSMPGMGSRLQGWEPALGSGAGGAWLPRPLNQVGSRAGSLACRQYQLAGLRLQAAELPPKRRQQAVCFVPSCCCQHGANR
mgnify:CR=1 FL=1